MKRANLIFTNGKIVMVPVNSETFPETIDHQYYTVSGSAAKIGEQQQEVTSHTTRFYYVGVQYGVGAYTEKETHNA